MIGLLQRVSHASVSIENKVIAQIERGLLVLLAVEKNDSSHEAQRLAKRIAGYRVFPDDDDKMNLSILDIKASVLLVPQFTLAANTNKGLRPSFQSAAEPSVGRTLFTNVFDELMALGVVVMTGRFGADMQVNLTNDGPVTFWLQVKPKSV